jgi:hypothetical protein
LRALRHLWVSMQASMKSTKCKTLINEPKSVVVLPPTLKLDKEEKSLPDKARKDDSRKFEVTNLF